MKLGFMFIFRLEYIHNDLKVINTHYKRLRLIWRLQLSLVSVALCCFVGFIIIHNDLTLTVSTH